MDIALSHIHAEKHQAGCGVHTHTFANVSFGMNNKSVNGVTVGLVFQTLRNASVRKTQMAESGETFSFRFLYL